jgi:DNA-directed RNA polymerase specialized sigma24 family protein
VSACIYCGAELEPGHRCAAPSPAQRAVETKLRQLVAEDLRRGRLERTYLTEQFLLGRSLAEVAHGAGIGRDDVRRRLRRG